MSNLSKIQLPQSNQFSAQIDFSEKPFGNIYFWDGSGSDILLYVSLLPNSSLVKVSTCKGGVWGSTVQKAVEISDTTAELEIVFGEGSALVSVNGREVTEFALAPTDIANMATIETRGANYTFVEMPSFLSLLESVQGGLFIQSPFRVSGWGYDPTSLEQNHRIVVPGLKDHLAVVSIPNRSRADTLGSENENVDLQALLPGRIWLAQGDPEKLSLRLTCNGKLAGEPLLVSRDDVIATIESIADSDPAENIFQAVVATEHVRFGDLWDRLSDKGRKFINKTVSVLGLHEFFQIDHAEQKKAEPQVTLPKRNLTSICVNSFITTYARAIEANPDLDDLELLLELLSESLFSPEERCNILFNMTQHFCAIDRFEDLYPHVVGAFHHAIRYNEKDGNFRISMVLPYLAIRGDTTTITKAIYQISKKPEDWIVTPALAWAIRYILKNRIEVSYTSTSNQFEDTIRAFLKLVSNQAANYWRRAQCEHLIKAGVAVISEYRCFSPRLLSESVDGLLRTYGLSRQFWRQIAPMVETGDLPAEFRLGAKAFAEIEQFVVGERDNIDDAMRLFSSWNCHDLQRFRIELMGPFSVPVKDDDTGLQIIDRLRSEHSDLGDSVMRGLSFPGVSIEDKDLAEISVQKIRSKREAIRRSPEYLLQKATSLKAAALLDKAKENSGQVSAQDVKELLGMCASLENEGTSHCGLSIAVNTISGLALSGCTEGVSVIAGYVQTMLKNRDKENLAQSRFLISSFPRLRAVGEMLDDPVILALIGAFPKSFGNTPRLPLDSVSEQVLDMWLNASPLYDTLVVMYSCQAYLDTRVKELRESWLGELKAMGIPYIVLVGGGNDELIGDVLYLNTPDDYENLRYKSLKLARWVNQNTPFAHYIKVDDDCFIDTAEYFGSLSYRKSHYYGRSVKRQPGATPRNWHMERATTDRGRFELNRSPEPTHFADGGSGYALSRTAMNHVDNYAATQDGAHLLLLSVSEDKFIGDTLAQAGIQCNSDDNYVTVYRRTSLSGHPVLRWSNDFTPSKAAPVKLVHFDGHPDRLGAVKHQNSYGLHPKRIWPSSSPVKLGFATKSMELVSSEERLFEVNAQEIVVSCVLRNEIIMLPRFLEHYRRLGVKGFIFTDNLSDDGSLEYLLEQPDVAVFSADTAFKETTFGSDWKVAVPAQLRMNRWTLVADADEFLVYPDYENTSLEAYVKGLDEKGYDGVRTYMVDMYPKGPLAEADFEQEDPFEAAAYCDKQPVSITSLSKGTYTNTATYTSNLRHRLIADSRPNDFVAQKVPLFKYRPWMRLSSSLHSATDVTLSPDNLMFAHFKYSAEFHEKVQREVLRAQHFNNGEEYKKYLDLLSEGRDVLYEEDESMFWKDCEFVKTVLKI